MDEGRIFGAEIVSIWTMGSLTGAKEAREARLSSLPKPTWDVLGKRAQVHGQSVLEEIEIRWPGFSCRGPQGFESHP